MAGEEFAHCTGAPGWDGSNSLLPASDQAINCLVICSLDEPLKGGYYYGLMLLLSTAGGWDRANKKMGEKPHLPGKTPLQKQCTVEIRPWSVVPPSYPCFLPQFFPSQSLLESEVYLYLHRYSVPLPAGHQFSRPIILRNTTGVMPV